MQYRRSQLTGGTFFFTVVTYQRRPLFRYHGNVTLLKNAFKFVKTNYPFVIDAIVILLDHLHYIWTLPKGDNNFSLRWSLIKRYFSKQYSFQFIKEIPTSRIKKHEKWVWQRRFWEHEIKNEADFRHHLNYIHYNPVKHKLCKNPIEWPYSSFKKHVHSGFYEIDWGANGDFIEISSAHYE